MHRIFKCPQACERLFSPCGHECPNDCGDPCGLCTTKIHDIELLCGHIKDHLSCHQTKDLSKVRCTVLMPKKIPGCNHVVEVLCHRDVLSDLFKCPEPCVVDLACGHQCPGTCGSCITQARGDHPAVIKHRNCAKICGRRQGSCNHTCPLKCHDGEDCGLCLHACEVNIPRSLLCHPRDTRRHNIQLSYPFPQPSKRLARLLLTRLRSDVHTLDAIRNATRPARHAFKIALGHVSIRDVAPCHALRLVIAFRARNAVPKNSLAAINVRASVARFVQ